jgi:WD40 repeat protein
MALRRRITDCRRDCSMPAWSPDGRKIVYVQESENGNSLWLSDPDGKNPKMLVKSGFRHGAFWLPDSKNIVWFALTPGRNPAESSKLYVMNTSERARLSRSLERTRAGPHQKLVLTSIISVIACISLGKFSRAVRRARAMPCCRSVPQHRRQPRGSGAMKRSSAVTYLPRRD